MLSLSKVFNYRCQHKSSQIIKFVTQQKPFTASSQFILLTTLIIHPQSSTTRSHREKTKQIHFDEKPIT